MHMSSNMTPLASAFSSTTANEVEGYFSIKDTEHT